MQQPPPAICTDPVNVRDAVVDISSGVMAVGVSEAVGVMCWLDPSVGGMGVLVSVGGIRLAAGVGLAAFPSPGEDAQETVINTRMQNKIRVFIVVLH